MLFCGEAKALWRDMKQMAVVWSLFQNIVIWLVGKILGFFFIIQFHLYFPRKSVNISKAAIQSMLSFRSTVAVTSQPLFHQLWQLNEVFPSEYLRQTPRGCWGSLELGAKIVV